MQGQKNNKHQGTGANGLTDRQQKVYRYIMEYTAQKGYPPAIREICDGTGIKSTATVFYVIRELATAGILSQEEGKTRAIKIVKPLDVAQADSQKAQGPNREKQRLEEENRVLASWIAALLVYYGDTEFKFIKNVKAGNVVVDVTKSEVKAIRNAAASLARRKEGPDPL